MKYSPLAVRSVLCTFPANALLVIYALLTKRCEQTFGSVELKKKNKTRNKEQMENSTQHTMFHYAAVADATNKHPTYFSSKFRLSLKLTTRTITCWPPFVSNRHVCARKPAKYCVCTHKCVPPCLDLFYL